MKETFLMERSFARVQEREHCVLVLVLATQESTYQKAGATALVNRKTGRIEGLVSGGCLEGDLLHRIESLGEGAWHHLRYDTRDEIDDLLGTALGCRGCLDLALIPMAGKSGEALAKVCRASWAAETPSRTQVHCEGFGSTQPTLSFHLENAQEAGNSRQADETLLQLNLAGTLPADFLFSPFSLPQRSRLLICGAGPDALPLVNMATELGFEVVVADHRAESRERLLFDYNAGRGGCSEGAAPLASPLRIVTLDQIPRELGTPLLAAIVMTHNLHRDASCLDFLSEVNMDETYLGVLGPQRRRREVMAQTRWGLEGRQHPLDNQKLHGPVGMPCGARGAGEIALSILADVLLFRLRRNSRQSVNLTEKEHVVSELAGV